MTSLAHERRFEALEARETGQLIRQHLQRRRARRRLSLRLLPPE
jgi:hypothetical protein